MSAGGAGQPPDASLVERHPELRAILSHSERFRGIAERHRVELDGKTYYIVRGDTLGSKEELLVDVLVRGSADEGADPESRALFLELSEPMKNVIRGLTRPDSEGRMRRSGPSGSGGKP